MVVPEPQAVIPNTTVRFKSTFKGTPPFTVKWFKEDTELITGPSCFIGLEGLSSFIDLYAVGLSSTGPYSCHVSNDAGTAKCTTSLLVKGRTFIFCCTITIFICFHHHLLLFCILQCLHFALVLLLSLCCYLCSQSFHHLAHLASLSFFIIMLYFWQPSCALHFCSYLLSSLILIKCVIKLTYDILPLQNHLNLYRNYQQQSF